MEAPGLMLEFTQLEVDFGFLQCIRRLLVRDEAETGRVLRHAR